MPNRPKPPTEFARRMLEARTRSGLRLDEASVMARDILGASYGPSRETIRRYETGMISEERADPLVVIALAEIYGVSVGQISWIVAQQSKAISRVFSRHLRRDGLDALAEEGQAIEEEKAERSNAPL